MSTFALDKNYQQFNFEEISVDELQIISGGSGGYSSWSDADKAGIGLGGLAVTFGIALASNPIGWGVGATLLIGTAASGFSLGQGIFG